MKTRTLTTAATLVPQKTEYQVDRAIRDQGAQHGLYMSRCVSWQANQKNVFSQRKKAHVVFSWPKFEIANYKFIHVFFVLLSTKKSPSESKGKITSEHIF